MLWMGQGVGGTRVRGTGAVITPSGIKRKYFFSRSGWKICRMILRNVSFFPLKNFKKN